MYLEGCGWVDVDLGLPPAVSLVTGQTPDRGVRHRLTFLTQEDVQSSCRHKPAGSQMYHHHCYLSCPGTFCSLTYVSPIHVVVEGEAVGGVVGDGGGRGRALGVHVEDGRQQPGLVSVQPRPRRLDVHVETCETDRGQRSAQGFKN